MTALNDTFTSTGAKFFAHQEVMWKLRARQGQPVVSHIMLTDVCNHKCAFCSVQARAGDSLHYYAILRYVDTLLQYGLKAVILSGGGNPILYRCKETGHGFNEIVGALHCRGLEIGLITNGMPLRDYNIGWEEESKTRKSWVTVRPSTLDKLTWVRISMSGLDHKENEVYVPDVDPSKTALGFSYVAHDIYHEPADPHHGQVSRPLDLISGSPNRSPDLCFEERVDDLTLQVYRYCSIHKPRYVRLLPNCLEPELIPQRCKTLSSMASEINHMLGTETVFVQEKPPAAPRACYLGYIHPVLNCDGWVYPCDSCVLNEEAGHTFKTPWRVCRMEDIASLYDQPVRSLIADPAKTCPGCVFGKSNNILTSVVEGTADLTPPTEVPTHANFV